MQQSNSSSVHPNYSQFENASYSSLSRKRDEEQMHQKYGQISFMENFLQSKYSQVGDLQKHLIQELQFIQKSKNKQKNIEKVIDGGLIPLTKELKSIFQGVKECLFPFQALLGNYIQIIAEKSKDLLILKQHKIQDQELEIQKLKKENSALKQQLQLYKVKDCAKYKEDIHNLGNQMECQQQILFNREKNVQKEEKNSQNIFRNSSSKVYNLSNQIYRHTGFNLEDKVHERSPLRSINSNKKSDNKQIKNEKNKQVHVNSLFNKTLNISYKCSKSPDGKKLTPSQSVEKIIQTKKQEVQLKTRKQLIKQKIQNIKKKNDKSSHKNQVYRLL